MLVLFAVPAFAGSKATTVTIPSNVQVGSTQLPAGDYKLTWTGSGANVQATLLKNEKAVITFSAKMVQGKSDPGVETYTQGGASTLLVIHTNNFSLDLENAPQSGQ